MNTEVFHGTTILSVRRGNTVALGGDGQVTLGNVVVKASARKVRRLYHEKILAGFAGGTADAFTLFERFEAKLEKRSLDRNVGRGHNANRQSNVALGRCRDIVWMQQPDAVPVGLLCQLFCVAIDHEFEVVPDATGTTIHQTAVFDPMGLWGLLYWYSLVPVHGFIFGGMLREIAARATSATRR